MSKKTPSLSQAELFTEVVTKDRSEASLKLARGEFKLNATGTMAWPEENSERKTLTIFFDDLSVAYLKMEDWEWEWVRGW